MLSPCTAIERCWEWYYGSLRSRVSQRDLALADALIRLRVAALGSSPSITQLQTVRSALDLSISLRGRQWREMTRAPFNFPFKLKIATVEASKPTPKKPTLDNLLELIS